MEILNHPSCTKILAADEGEPDCESLPVAEREDDFGAWSISFWKPSVEEIEVLSKGGSIALWVKARDDDHPVVSIAVQNK